jgi:hypothetical protein
LFCLVCGVHRPFLRYVHIVVFINAWFVKQDSYIRECVVSLHLPTNQGFVNSLFPFMDMVAAEVKSGKLSADKGQYLIAEKINELDAAQRSSIVTNNKSNNSTMTNCHVVGNTVNCHSF